MERSTITTQRQGGIGFLGLLAIVFITLKLLGYISWSWWWVLAPLWVPLAVVLTLVAAFFGFYLLAILWEHRKKLFKRG